MNLIYNVMKIMNELIANDIEDNKYLNALMETIFYDYEPEGWRIAKSKNMEKFIIKEIGGIPNGFWIPGEEFVKYLNEINYKSNPKEIYIEYFSKKYKINE